MRTREAAAARLLRRFQEAIELRAKLEEAYEKEVATDVISTSLIQRKKEAESKFNRLRGTLYRMVMASSEPFTE